MEETQGTRIVLADLPTAGPFAVKLPTGSYRVIRVRFDNLWGTWRTMHPTSFQVQPGGCTSLGTWKLQRETESLTDWITGRASKHFEPTHAQLHSIPALKRPWDKLDIINFRKNIEDS